MAFMQKIQLYDVVDTNECWTQTGKPPVTTKWVRVNKGTSAEPDVRCRLVARDFKPKGERDRSEIFAAMPHLSLRNSCSSRRFLRTRGTGGVAKTESK